LDKTSPRALAIFLDKIEMQLLPIYYLASATVSSEEDEWFPWIEEEMEEEEGDENEEDSED